RLEMVDIGGGIPARYVAPVPSLAAVAAAIRRGLGRLPYQPPLVAAEPGRSLVAESGVLAATVIGVETRAGERWAYLDVGGYNGFPPPAALFLDRRAGFGRGAPAGPVRLGP